MLRAILPFGYLLLFGAGIAHASPVQKNTGAIQWYQPTIKQTTDATHSWVQLSGQANPGTKIQLESGTVAIYGGKKVRDLSFKELGIKSSDIILRPNGEFKFFMNLPYANIEIPIAATTTRGYTQHYILLMDVTKRSVKITSGNVTEPPTKWYANIGPVLKLFSWSQSNSTFSWKNSFAIFGSTVGLGHAINHKNHISLTLTSAQGVGSLPTGANVTFSDFEYALDYTHTLSWQPIQRVKIASDFGYTLGNLPFFIRNASSNYAFQTATGNNLTLGLTGSFGRSRLGESVGIGLVYGIVNASGINSTSNLMGGYAKYALAYRLSFPFYLFGDFLAQYETYGFSAYDTPTSKDLKNSINQTIFSTDAGIQCRF